MMVVMDPVNIQNNTTSKVFKIQEVLDMFQREFKKLEDIL